MNPAQLQKWQKAIDNLCMYMNLDKEQIFHESKEHIASLQQRRREGKGAYVVGDLYSQSMHHLFLEVKERADRRTSLSESRKELLPELLPDIWAMIVDCETISSLQLSLIKPLLRDICDNWWDYVSMGSDNDELGRHSYNIYKTLDK